MGRLERERGLGGLLLVWVLETARLHAAVLLVNQDMVPDPSFLHHSPSFPIYPFSPVERRKGGSTTGDSWIPLQLTGRYSQWAARMTGILISAE